MIEIPFPNHVYVGTTYAPAVSYQADTPPNWSWEKDDIGSKAAIVDEYAVECLDKVVTGEILGHF